MLCDGWVQRIPDHLNIVFSAASTAQRRSCRDVKGSENIPMLTQRCVVSFSKIDIGLGSWLLYLSPPGQG